MAVPASGARGPEAGGSRGERNRSEILRRTGKVSRTGPGSVPAVFSVRQSDVPLEMLWL